ncbi:hypothetical protein LTR10_001033 [Elasticomyces elasticus]|nr:hypothetical protein LTR10_001033 [Elasticomyces elasticus]
MLTAITWRTYTFFAAWMLGGLFVYFFLPETAGRTLEKMDAAFGSHSSQADRARLARVQHAVGLNALLDGEESTQGDEKGPQDTVVYSHV